MKILKHNPEGIYPATPDYAHAIEVQNPNRFLYVSGTMGLDEKGVAGKDLSEQLALIWSNIEAILESAKMTVGNVVRVTSYLRDVSYAEENKNARIKALKGNIVPTTVIVAQTLVSEWLVEIEIIAAD